MHRLSRAWFTLITAMAVVGCNRAFRSRAVPAPAPSESFELTFAFAGGGSEATVVSGDAATVELALPTIGYRKVVDVGADFVDASRLSIAPSVDLGDPQAGGVPLGTDVAAELAAAGRLHAVRSADGRAAVQVVIDEADLAPFPIGRMLWSIVVLDDVDRAALPLYVGLTVRAPDKPTATLALEIPPFQSTVPTAISLPLDGDGVPFTGSQLPFVLSLRAIPNFDSGARFERLFPDGLVDPARLSIVADRDLGDPAAGGLAAGENLAPLVGIDLDLLVDEATGETVASLLFPFDGSYLPAIGDTTFHANVLDDADVVSFDATTIVRVVTAVTLSADVQPILSSRCASAACHDNVGPAAGMRLTTGNTFGDVVRVRSGQTPSDSCALLRIDPYFLDFSYLWRKVNNTHRGDCVKGSGSKMPSTGSLTPAQLATIESWILQGAHDR